MVHLILGGDMVLSDWADTLRYLNPATLARVPRSSVSGATLRAGNLGCNTVRGPARHNVDLGLAKNFHLTKQHRLQVRADLFNALNTRN